MAIVGIVIGSDSDLPVMKEAAAALEELGISYELRIMSAHRTPDEAAAFSRGAREAGMRVIIAGAGGAAHLPGAMAAHTTLPVIGVPIASSSGTLGGLDALLSIVQMPRGVPVATVGINGARNAGLLAAEILGAADPEIAHRLADLRAKIADAVRAGDKELQGR